MFFCKKLSDAPFFMGAKWYMNTNYIVSFTLIKHSDIFENLHVLALPLCETI